MNGIEIGDDYEHSIRPVVHISSDITGTVGDTISINTVTPPENALVNSITSADYGKSINYSVSIANSASTENTNGSNANSLTGANLKSGTDTISNWKVFYNDGTNVYIILDDVLKYNQLPENTSYARISDNNYWWYEDDYCHINSIAGSIDDSTYWQYLANGNGALSAKGGPSYEQLKNSWNNNPNNTSVLNDTISEQSDLIDASGLYLLQDKIIERYNYPPGAIGNSETMTGQNLHVKCYFLTDFTNQVTSYNERTGETETSGTKWYCTDNSIVGTNIVGAGYYYRPVVKLNSNLTGTIGDTVVID